FDIIVDGTDNFPTRYLVNDACVLTGKPNVYASVDRFAGQASVFATETGPCYRCLHPVPPPPGTVPSCAEGGVLGVLPGLLGILQATEVLKLILGVGEPLIGRVLQVDALALRFREFKLKKNPECPVCGTHPSITRLLDYQEICAAPDLLAKNALVDNNTSMINGIPQMEPAELKRRLDAGECICVLDVREPHEFATAQIGGRLIPLNDLPQRVGELDPTQEIVVHCKLGGRSQRAAEFLAQAGFKKLHNLSGGIQAWSEKVDPAVPKY
ncbi:MAG TPA: ThiF family adenylyltransferase, partial [Acidobacteriaceae bacterium]|nr:ThiF family adenylyltransferase [Acidobacteriaceae bacterium]